MTTSSKSCILIVEDHEATRRSLAHILHQAGYMVSQVPDGETALALLSTSGNGGIMYDVVLTDLLLQDVNGIDVLKAARQLPNPPEVILLTGYGTMHSVIDALRQDVFDYLLKPCNPDTLLQCVSNAVMHRNKLLQHQHALSAIEASLQLLRTEESNQRDAMLPLASSSRNYRIGLLVIDQIAHTITFDGREIQVTRTEYEIMCVLAAHANVLVTYQMLAQQIYAQNLNAYESHQLLKTHIHNLRNKIDRNYIVNVRGAGYRLVHPGEMNSTD